MRRIGAGVIVGMMLAAGRAQATRPLTVDDADPTPVGQCQLTAAVGIEGGGGCRDWDVPVAAAYGVLPDLELSVAFGGQRAEIADDAGRSAHACGCNDLLLGAKWQFLGESTWLPRQTLEPAVKFPTASRRKGLGSGRPDYDLTWVASKTLPSGFQLDLNVGHTWIGHSRDEPDTGVLHGGLALEYALSDRWQIVGEMFGERETGGNGEVALQDRAGLRWQVVDGLTLDAAVGNRLRGSDTPRFTATFGLSWVFGAVKKKE